MIKRNNKKGFTIVELVIVIAVIAILAAVLIPTFSGIVKKAQLSSDQQAVRNMNIALVASGEVKSIDAAIDALSENGFNAEDTLVPVTKGYAFYWFETANTVLLVEMTEGENPVPKAVVYPEDETLAADFMAAVDELRHNLKAAVVYIDVTVADADSFKTAIIKGQKDITLEADVSVEATMNILSDTTIHLNGKNLNASANDARPFELADGATLTINAENSTINCGKYGLVNIQSGANANVVINGGTITANTDNGAFIKPRGAGNITVTLNNVNYTDSSSDGYIVNAEAYTGTELNVIVKGGSFKAQYGLSTRNATISDAKFDTQGVAITVTEKAEITNCTITTANALDGSAPAAGVAVSSNGEANVTKCTINTAGIGFAVYSSGGKIVATDNTVTATEEYRNTVNGLYNGSEKTFAYISINGDVKVDVEYTK